MAVYALKSLHEVIHYGYFCGVAFYFEAIALDASAKTAKQLPAPQPGVCTYNPERSAPEWRFHEDSFNLKGVRLQLDEMRALMKDFSEKSSPSGNLVPHMFQKKKKLADKTPDKPADAATTSSWADQPCKTRKHASVSLV